MASKKPKAKPARLKPRVRRKRAGAPDKGQSTTATAKKFAIVTAPSAKSQRKPQNGEITSPLVPLPENFDFIASKSEEERAAYMRELLARSEDEALGVIVPAFTAVRTAVDIFQVYRPLVLVLKEHFCKPGRPAQGKKTWRQVCREHLGVGIRRVQQLLAGPTETDRQTPQESAPDGKVSIRLTLTMALTAQQKDQFQQARERLGTERTTQLIFDAVVRAAQEKRPARHGSPTNKRSFT